jgi:hypothetical protein
MTFNETIAHMNSLRPTAQYHIWQDYAGGKTGYSTSRDTLAAARSMAAKLPNGRIYDRNGEDVD